MPKVSEDLTNSGSLFHTSAAAKEKDLSPNVLRLFFGATYKPFLEERRVRDGTYFDMRSLR